MPDLPVYHKLPEFTQTHVHRVGDAIQPSHPLLSPSPPAPNPSQQTPFSNNPRDFSVHGHHQMINIEIKLIIFFAPKYGEALYSPKIRPGADCGSDHELLIAKFRLKLKKVRKSTRPFRYELNQMPFDYTVELMSRFKGLNLVERMLEELWTEVHNIVQEAVIKTTQKIKKCKKAKWLSEEVLQIAEEKREAKGKWERER